MEDAAKYADQIVIMQQGHVVKQGTPIEIFSSLTELVEMGLDVPEVVRFQRNIEDKLGIKLGATYLTIEELSTAVAKLLRGAPV
jgi:energy-coupling factor transport system ATP-binding protein